MLTTLYYGFTAGPICYFSFFDDAGLQRQALAMNHDIFGDDHPETSIRRSNLALALENQGRHAEAETLFREFWPRFAPSCPRATRTLLSS